MNESDLEKILDGEKLLEKLDVKTLILDLINKQTTQEELIELFMQKLPNLDEAYVKRFFYMKRH